MKRIVLALTILVGGAVALANTQYQISDTSHDITFGGNSILLTAGTYYQLVQASGTAASPREYAFAGNPNGTVTGVKGDLLLDVTTPAIWQSTGGTAWSEYSTTAAIPATSNLLQGTGTAGSSQASNETDNGTTFGAGADFLVTLSTGHFTGASGGYVTGSTGFSNTAAAFTPGTLVDIRTNSTQPFEVFRYNATASGTNMAFGRGRGTIAAPAALSLGDQILQMIIYGYDSNNAINNNALISTNIDQAVGAGVVPSNFLLQLEDAGGTLRNRFRIDSAGHVIYPVITTPVATSCGSSPTVVGDDANGSVTVGTAATGCTLTFGTSYATPTPTSTANCVLTAQSSIVFTYAVSNTALTITSGASSSVVFNWICAGY
jgi:hypothetical protein